MTKRIHQEECALGCEPKKLIDKVKNRIIVVLSTVGLGLAAQGGMIYYQFQDLKNDTQDIKRQLISIASIQQLHEWRIKELEHKNQIGFRSPVYSTQDGVAYVDTIAKNNISMNLH